MWKKSQCYVSSSYRTHSRPKISRFKVLESVRAFIFIAPDYLSEDVSDDVGDGDINNVAW